jgi:Glycosyltransferase
MAYTQKRRTTHPGEKQTDEYLRENMITDAERAANRGMPSSNWMTEVSDGQNGVPGMRDCPAHTAPAAPEVRRVRIRGNLMRIALICQFEPGTAEYVLMAGRRDALLRLGHTVLFIVHPFKSCCKRQFLPLMLLGALYGSLRIALWRPEMALIQKLLPLGLVYQVLLLGVPSTVIADDWEGVGGFVTQRGRRWIPALAVTACEELMPRMATHTWAVSRVLAERWPWAVYYPNGGALSINPVEIRKADEFTVVHVGTYKDPILVDMLVKIAQALKYMSVKLVYVGGGPLLQRLCDGLAYTNCETTGQVPVERAHELMLSAHVGLLYLSHESMMIDVSRSSTKLAEYMAAGCAVVASDVGEATTLVEDGSTGLLVPNDVDDWFLGYTQSAPPARTVRQHGVTGPGSIPPATVARCSYVTCTEEGMWRSQRLMGTSAR